MMYKWDDILIVGDSFAGDRRAIDNWPVALTLKLTGDEYSPQYRPRGQGFPGASWWSTRTNLLKELETRIPKVLIMCHTNEDRLQSDNDYGLNIGCCTDNHIAIPIGDTNYSPDILNAARQYFKYLYSPSYHLWAMDRWFNELESILNEKKIPVVIHLHSFPKKTPGNPGRSDVVPKVFDYGVTSEEILYNLSVDKYNHPTDFTEASGEFNNHFKTAENLTIANALHAAVVNFKSDLNGTIQNLNLLQQ